MEPEMKSPGAANTRARNNKRAALNSNQIDTPTDSIWQSSLSTCHLASSLNMSLSSAAAIALANGWGDVH